MGINPCSQVPKSCKKPILEEWRLRWQQINVLILLIHSGRVRRRSSVPMPKWCWSAASWTWGRTSTSWESLPNTDSFPSPTNRWGENTTYLLNVFVFFSMEVQPVSESINSIKAWNWLLFLLPQPNNATVIFHVWRTEMYLFYLFNSNIFGTCMTHRLKCTVLCNFPLQWFSFAYSDTDLRTNSVVSSETNDTHYFVPLCTQTKLLKMNSEGDICFSS